MSLLVLLILAGAWAAVLLPPYLRNHSVGHRGDSVASFRQQLSTLQQATPGQRNLPVGAVARPVQSLGPRPGALRRSEVKRRRRDILVTLLAANAFTLVLGVLGLTVSFLFFLLTAALTGGYVFLLLQLKRVAAERREKVRYLPTAQASAPAPAEPALVLRRSASR